MFFLIVQTKRLLSAGRNAFTNGQVQVLRSVQEIDTYIPTFAYVDGLGSRSRMSTIV
jgi:hypothetical protein